MIYDKETFGIIAVTLTVIGNIDYLGSIIRGTSRPHTITWLIWVVVMAISFLGQLGEGAGPGSWNTGFGVLMGSVIFLLALRKGETSISRFDWSCLILAVFSIILYIFSEKVLYSMLLVTLIDMIGYFPTLRKSIIDPLGEPLRSWIILSSSWFFSLLAVRVYSLETVLYPAVIVGMNSLLLLIIVIKRREVLALSQRG